MGVKQSQQPRMMSLRGGITIAGHRLQGAQIGDLDPAPAVADDAGALQRMGDQ